MKAIVGYVRASTNKQSLTIDAQVNAIEAYCVMRDLDLIDIVIERGVSGGKIFSTRDGGASVEEYLTSGRADGLVAVKLCRLFRRTADALDTIHRWSSMNYALHIIDMNGATLDTSCPMGRFVLTLISAVGELSRGLIAENTSAALQQKKRDGVYLGRAPYGRKIDPETRRLVVCKEEMKLVERVMSMRGSGMTYQSICDNLDKSGVVSRVGKRFNPSQVHSIVKRNGSTAIGV